MLTYICSILVLQNVRCEHILLYHWSASFFWFLDYNNEAYTEAAARYWKTAKSTFNLQAIWARKKRRKPRYQRGKLRHKPVTQYLHRLLQNRRTRKHQIYAAFAFLFYIGTLITSEIATGKTFHPPLSKLDYPLSVDFLGWLIFHKLLTAALLLVIGDILKDKAWWLLAIIAVFEVPECLIYYEQPWARLNFFGLLIPLCCDTFTTCIFSYMCFIRPIVKWKR